MLNRFPKLMMCLSGLFFAAIFGALGYYVFGHDVPTRYVNGIPNDRLGMAFSGTIFGFIFGICFLVVFAAEFEKNDDDQH